MQIYYDEVSHAVFLDEGSRITTIDLPTNTKLGDVNMSEVKLGSPEEIATAFKQIGTEIAEGTRLSDASEFQAKAVDAGLNEDFAAILAKAIAGTYNADETLDAMDKFFTEEITNNEGADNQ